MKKVIALALTAAMATSLAACGGSSSSSAAASSTPASAPASSAASSQAPSAPSAGATEGYPGGFVTYREGDPAGDPDAQITSTDKVEWTIAVCLQESNPQSVAIQKIADELAEKTNGNFTWDIFFNSELGSESEAVELVRNNTAQLVTSNVTVMSTYVEDYGIFALPYLFHSEEDLLTYLAESDVATGLYTKLEESANLVTLGFNCTGTRCLSTNGVKQVKSPDELKAAGVKVRSMEAQVWQDVISSLGATPVPVAYTELYTALQTGVVQGQDNPISNTVDGKFYEVLDTFYETDHAFLVSAYYTNPESWDALPDDYKALLGGLMQKYEGDYYHEEILKFREECKKTVEDAGVTIVPQSELDMDAFYASADAMIQEKYASNPAYAAYIEDVKTTFNY